ncbi:hypothetical protein RWE15_03725 [Virgibacillus halophilus]|uniref:Uncharacterized protein n=1 Tax=Tigheibacillus halophilus TaxID=361280 RepID=A0ABU5C340_9BACI|nr:hypothetical protein [Virgibacillus halophilus]
MKKWLSVLISVLFIAVLAACSTSSTSGSGKVIVKTGAGDITEEDLYKELKKI